MRRIVALGVLLGVGCLSIAVTAGQRGAVRAQPAPLVVAVEKLTDNLFVLKGGGGNTAVFVTSDGVIVVDTKNPGWGQALLSKIREITSKPVTTIINTHGHSDHVSGNLEFPASIDIIAQENTSSNMERMVAPTGFPPQPPSANIFRSSNGRGMPKKTFKEKLTIGRGKERIDLYYFGPGHTDGDTWVVFRDARVLHAGDMFSGKNLPLIDANNGGSGVEYPATLKKALSKVGGIRTIITGHSTQMTMKDLREYAEFNANFLKTVRASKEAGLSVDDVANSWKMPEQFDGYQAPQPDRLRSNVQVIFDELK